MCFVLFLKHMCLAHFLVVEDTNNGNMNLAMLENWLMPQLMGNEEQDSFSINMGPLHLGIQMSGGISIDTCQVNALVMEWPQTFCTCPPRSLDLTVSDIFLWGYVKDSIYITPLPAMLLELRRRITAAIENVAQDMLERVWHERDHCLDVCHITHGAHSECF